MKFKFFEAARKASLKSEHPSHPMGCVIVKKNRVISKGFNKLKTHPKSQFPYKTTHAEFHAIIRCWDPDDLKGASAYIYRSLKNGENAMAKPCPSCLKTLQEFGITEVYYTTSEGFVNERI